MELLKRRFDVYDCRWFESVDPVEMEIPDYPEIIKEPICFLDIQKKFSRNVYERTGQYVADMNWCLQMLRHIILIKTIRFICRIASL